MDAETYAGLVSGEGTVRSGEREPERRSWPALGWSSKVIDMRHRTLFLAGGMTVWLDGASPRSRLARLLIDAFVEAPGRAFAPEELGRAVWPEEPSDDARRGRLKVAIHRLRAAGCPIARFEGGYAIDPDACIVDLGAR